MVLFAGSKEAVVGAHVCTGGKMDKARKVQQTLRASSPILQEQGKSLMTNLPDDGSRGDVMQSAVIEWGGSEMEIVFDPLNPPTIENFDKAVFLTYKSAETLLQWRPNSAREKVASKSLRTACQTTGLNISPFFCKCRDSLGKVNSMMVISWPEFRFLASWDAAHGNAASVRFAILDIVFAMSRHKKEPASKLERKVQEKYAKHVKGSIEVRCDVGIVDIVTQTHAIEVKHVDHWKSAVGQALVYGKCLGLSPEVHLFGASKTVLAEQVESYCNALGVRVTWA